MELLEANSHYALIKDQRGITKTVSVQDLAPYPRNNIQNSDDVLLQDFDELAIEAAKSNPRVSIPRLSVPENILNSSKSSYQNAKLDESSNSSNKEIEDSEGENVESSSTAREKFTKCGRISRAPTKFEGVLTVYKKILKIKKEYM